MVAFICGALYLRYNNEKGGDSPGCTADRSSVIEIRLGCLSPNGYHQWTRFKAGVTSSMATGVELKAWPAQERLWSSTGGKDWSRAPLEDVVARIDLQLPEQGFQDGQFGILRITGEVKIPVIDPDDPSAVKTTTVPVEFERGTVVHAGARAAEGVPAWQGFMMFVTAACALALVFVAFTGWKVFWIFTSLIVMPMGLISFDPLTPHSLGLRRSREERPQFVALEPGTCTVPVRIPAKAESGAWACQGVSAWLQGIELQDVELDAHLLSPSPSEAAPQLDGGPNSRGTSHRLAKVRVEIPDRPEWAGKSGTLLVSAGFRSPATEDSQPSPALIQTEHVAAYLVRPGETVPAPEESVLDKYLVMAFCFGLLWLLWEAGGAVSRHFTGRDGRRQAQG
ncbi:MAG: hypothetical protein R3F17_01670 [Planctomycetota bacterium]